MLLSILADLRYALRGLRNAPGYAATVILTLALGLGATTAMLAIADSVLLRPLGFPHAERMDSLRFLNSEGVEQWNATWKNYEALHDGVKSFEAIAAYSSLPGPITTADGSVVKPVVHATPSLFEVAGVSARLGRTLTSADAHAPVVVISNGFWRDTLHGDARVLGSTLRIEGRPMTVVGVMPAGFSFPAQSAEGVAAYAPLEVDAKGADSHGFDSFFLVARRRAGVSRASGELEAQAVQRRLPPEPKEKPMQLRARPYLNSVVGEQQPALLALLAACALLLAISCVNAANLQIARSTLRSGEMAMRAALGASRARLLRQIVTESVTISLLGAGLGLLLASGAIHAARVAYGKEFARFDEIALHPAIFACCALLAIGAGVLAALAPALRVLRTVDGVQRAASSRLASRAPLSSVLVAAEVGLTCLLLIGAGLFVRTFQALEQVPLGFNPAGATEMVLMPEDPTQSSAVQQAIYARLIDRMDHLPSVSSAAFDSSLPFSSFQMGFFSSFHVLGDKMPGTQGVSLHATSAQYFSAMQVPLRRGRLFGPVDGSTTALVGLVNEEFVRKYVHDGDAVGKQIQFSEDIKQPLTIIGVVGDVLGGRDLSGSREPLLYLLPEQIPASFPYSHFLFGVAPQFVVRSQLPEQTLARELQNLVHGEAPGFAVMSIDAMTKNIRGSLASRRLALRLASGFGIVALLLSAAGIYGVLAYTVAQRTREIGIRMALGSSRRAALALVLRQAAVMCAFGMALGFAAVWPAARSIRSFLFGVPALDPLTLAVVAVLLALVCLLAAAVPARRAAAVDPMQALRAE